MEDKKLNFDVDRLGQCRVSSPMSGVKFVGEEDHVLYHTDPNKIEPFFNAGHQPPAFELAGPRSKIYFDPSKLKCGIVTCGGLCPGLNDVIRAIVMGLHYHYGVRTVFGLPYGYEGLSYKYGHAPVELNPEVVNNIHQIGGTILGSSRGGFDAEKIVSGIVFLFFFLFSFFFFSFFFSPLICLFP